MAEVDVTYVITNCDGSEGTSLTFIIVFDFLFDLFVGKSIVVLFIFFSTFGATFILFSIIDVGSGIERIRGTVVLEVEVGLIGIDLIPVTLAPHFISTLYFFAAVSKISVIDDDLIKSSEVK